MSATRERFKLFNKVKNMTKLMPQDFRVVSKEIVKESKNNNKGKIKKQIVESVIRKHSIENNNKNHSIYNFETIEQLLDIKNLFDSPKIDHGFHFYLNLLFNTNNVFNDFVFDDDTIYFGTEASLKLNISISHKIINKEREHLLRILHNGECHFYQGSLSYLYEQIIQYLSNKNLIANKTQYNLNENNFNNISNEIVDFCKTNHKGKAKQESITNILRKKAGFQSNQSFDNYISHLKSNRPDYTYIENEELLYNEYFQFMDVYCNEVAGMYFNHFFKTNSKLKEFGVADNCANECFFFRTFHNEKTIYILDETAVETLSKDQPEYDLSKHHHKYLVYVDTHKNEGLFVGEADINLNYKTLSTNSFKDALKYAISLVKK
jgi:uncharacterized short protein YbdD (DUF466 family)